MRVRPVLALTLASALAASAAVAVTATASGPRPATAQVSIPGLPDAAPPAAHQAEPQLPRPAGWPFGESFSRTSGTGRLAGGASYWTDFVYDDHGAVGVQQQQTSSLAPTIGTYTYPDGPAHGNGADIFRAAVGLDSQASYWRVDWTTLVDPTVPVAEWALDTDGNSSSTAVTWPAGAGLRSPGIDKAIVVSSRGARLLDVATGQSLATLSVTVDKVARSFVVRIPRTTLQVTNTWQLRLAAGLSNTAGTGFSAVSPANGALPGQPSVYNVAFRTAKQEAASCGGCTPLDLRGIGHGAHTVNANLWNETSQASTLAQGDVTEFRLGLKWADLTAKKTTGQPLVRGSSTRWYVTTLKLGEGVSAEAGGVPSQGDLEPNYRARIQPYTVYVPQSYSPGQASRLTWVLHSLGVNHNQYAALAPTLLKQLCDDRGSICASTLGFGADGWYYDEAEVDFWQVWREVAEAFTLDDTRTVISGYSMGGFASYKLGMTYPDVFAAAMPFAGPPVCGVRLAGGGVGPAGPGRCTDNGDTKPLIGNATWVPYNISDGVIDQLVPFSSVVEQVRAFDSTGRRYHFEAYPAEDHLLYAVQDGFSSQVAHLSNRTIRKNPGNISYTWYPNMQDATLGLGPTGAYWLRDLVARAGAADRLASIEATSLGRPERAHEIYYHHNVTVPGDPTPAVTRTLKWRYAPDAPAHEYVLKLTLTGVASLGVDMARAGFTSGKTVSVTVTTDGPTTLRFLRGGTPTVVHLTAGTRTLSVG